MKKVERILVADDEPDNLETLERLVKKLKPDATVVKAEDGLRAYQAARNEPFSLIVTDFKMPKLNGAKLINALRDNPFNRKCPTVVLSGFADEAKVDCDYFKLDRILYLEKPINSEGFVKSVTEFLENQDETTKKIVGTARPASIKLDVNFINPFLTAINDTLTALGGMKSLNKKGLEPINKEKIEKSASICGQIDIKSLYFSGRLSVLFPQGTFLKVSNRILDKNDSAITETNKGVVGEIANIVHGTAKRTLNENGYAIEPTLPKISVDIKECLSTASQQGICLDYDSDAGPFSVAIEIMAVAPV